MKLAATTGRAARLPSFRASQLPGFPASVRHDSRSFRLQYPHDDDRDRDDPQIRIEGAETREDRSARERQSTRQIARAGVAALSVPHEAQQEERGAHEQTERE